MIRHTSRAGIPPLRATAFLLALVATVVSFRPAHAATPTGFCDGSARPTVAEGSVSQVDAHTEVFAPRYAAACPSAGGSVSYLGTGDARGVKVITERLLPSAIGTGDVALTPAQKAIAEGDLVTVKGRVSPVLQIPLYVDGLAIAYNIPCTAPPVKFRSQVVSLIYSGTITTWNDPSLVADNPALSGCARAIALTKRADAGAGATILFKDYLAKRNPQWQGFKLPGFTEQWPTLNFACSGGGDAGMINCIRSRPGAIGYVRFGVAQTEGVAIGQIENLSGTFVTPSPASCSSAAQSAVVPPGVPSVDVLGVYKTRSLPSAMGDWSTVSITDATNGYPICSFSYAFTFYITSTAYGFNMSGGVLRNLIDYLWTALNDSTQAQLATLGLAKLPPAILAASREGVLAIGSSL